MNKPMQIIRNGKIKVKGIGNDRIFYEVGSSENRIKIIKYKDRTGSHYDCTCKNCSIFGEEAGICLYKAAVIAWEVLDVKNGKT